MTPKPEQRQRYEGWRHWNQWSAGKKISSVGFLFIVLLWYVFWNHLLPRLAEEERKAGASLSTAAPNLQIPRPDVPIPSNPNTRR